MHLDLIDKENITMKKMLEAYHTEQNGYRHAINAIRIMCDDTRLQRLVKSAERRYEYATIKFLKENAVDAASFRVYTKQKEKKFD